MGSVYLHPPSLSSSTCLVLKSFHVVHYAIYGYSIYIKLSLTLFVVVDLKEQLRKELEQVVGAHNVSCSESVRQQHGQDEGPHRGNTVAYHIALMQTAYKVIHNTGGGNVSCNRRNVLVHYRTYR